MSNNELPPAWSIKRWLFTTNHKDIGILYLVTAIYFLIAAGFLGILIRTQLVAPENNFLLAGSFNQAVTVHGMLMVLWFLSPFAFGFANYFVPIQIGAKDMAFPRLNALSYWFYLFSGILLLVSFFFTSAPDTGWTLYAPLTSAKYTPFTGFDIAATGFMMLVASVTMGTINFIVTIFRMRAPGMRLMNMPLFTWSILITTFMMLYAFPSLMAGLIIIFSDRTLGTIYLTSVEGGSILWDHIFWFFAHPEVYIVLFPGFGAIGDILTTFSRKPLYARKYIIWSMIAVALLSFVVWGHHMFVTGINPLLRKIFTITTIGVSLPFDVIIIAFIHTLVKGRIKLSTPVLFAIGSILLFVIGGITGVFLGSNALDYSLRGTYWVVAHFHYVMVGGGVMSLIGALYYWYPKMTGRMYNEKLGKLHFLLAFVGFNLLYFSMFFLMDMPRRVVTYTADTGWGGWNMVATIGSYIFGPSMLLMLFNLYTSLKRGQEAGTNPWKSWTLEWATSSPPPVENFESTPIIGDNGISFMQPTEAAHTMHVSPWPFMIALSTFVFLFGIALGLPVLLAGAVLGAIALAGLGMEKFVSPEPSAGERWPFEKVSKMKLGVWIFLASEIVLFGVLIGAYSVMRNNSEFWPQAGEILDIRHGAINTMVLLTSSFTAILALDFIKKNSRMGLLIALIVTLALGVWFLFNKASEWSQLHDIGFTFSSELSGSVYFLTTGIHGAHVIAGLVMLIYLITRTARKEFSKDNYHAVEHFGLYWHFVDIIWVFLFPIFYLL